MADIRNGKSSPLKNITSDYHYHTVEADSVETLDIIENMLKAKGFLVQSSAAWRNKTKKRGALFVMEEIRQLLQAVLNIDFIRAVISNPRGKEGHNKSKSETAGEEGKASFPV